MSKNNKASSKPAKPQRPKNTVEKASKPNIKPKSKGK